MNISLFGLVVAAYVLSGIYSGVKKKSKMTAQHKQVKQASPNQKIKQKKQKQQTQRQNKKVKKSVPKKSELIEEILVHMDTQDQNSLENLAASAPSADNKKQMERDEVATQDEGFDYHGVEPSLAQESSLSLDLDSREELARAMILKEILDPPLSMRYKRSRD